MRLHFSGDPVRLANYGLDGTFPPFFPPLTRFYYPALVKAWRRHVESGIGRKLIQCDNVESLVPYCLRRSHQAAGEREVAKRHTTRQHAVCLTFEPAEEGHVKQAVPGSLFGLGRTRTINKKKHAASRKDKTMQMLEPGS